MGGSSSKEADEAAQRQAKPAVPPLSALYAADVKRFCASAQPEGELRLSFDEFVRAFSLEEHIHIAHGLFKRFFPDSEPKEATEAHIVALMQDVGVAAPSRLRTVIFEVYAGPRAETISEAQLMKLFSEELAIAVDIVAQAGDDLELQGRNGAEIIEQLAQQAHGTKLAESLTKTEFASWAGEHCPCLGAGTSFWIREAVRGALGSETMDSDALSMVIPSFTSPSEILTPAAAWWLGCWLPRATRCGDLLFASAQHGLSFNRFKHHVTGYRGPTLCLFALSGGRSIALFTGDEWRDQATPAMFGRGDDAFLAAFPDCHRVSSGGAFNYLYNGSRGSKGLGAGGKPDELAFFVSSSFETVTTRRPVGGPAGYGWGDSALVSCEVWGLGGEAAANAQKRFASRRLDMARRERKVDRAAMFGTKKAEAWEDNPDSHILGMMGIGNNAASMGITRDDSPHDKDSK